MPRRTHSVLACMTTTPQAPALPRILYDRKNAAFALSISVRSYDYLVASKKIQTRRLGKKIMVTHGELMRFAQGNHFESVAS